MGSKVGILGGTGKEGRGLAMRWARAGREVYIGSRDRARGERIARELSRELSFGRVTGMSNREAAARADIVVSTLPHQGHLEILTSLGPELQGKLLVTATIAWPPSLSGKLSAAEEARQALGEQARIVAAFQTVSAGSLRRMDGTPLEDVLLFGDAASDRDEARALVDDTGLRGVVAGPLEGARVAEAMTGILIRINKLHRVKSAGLRITGLPGKEDG